MPELWKTLGETASAYPFQRREWVETWAETIGKDRGYRLLPTVVRDDAGKMGLLPLAIGTRAGVRSLEWAGAGVTDYNAPLLEPGFSVDPGRMLDTIEREAADSGCALVYLDRMPALLPDGPNPFIPSCALRHHVKAHSLATPPDMESYLAGVFGGKARYNLRRSARTLGGGRPPELRRVTEPERRAGAVAVLAGWKSGRYEATGAKNPFADPGVAAFYRGIVASPMPGVEVDELVAGDVPLALHLGIRDRHALYVLVPGFPAGGANARHSPGMHLFLALIESAVAENTPRVDFTIGDEAYKLRLCDREVELFAVVRGRGIRGRAVAAAIATTMRLKRRPCVVGTARTLSRVLRGIRVCRTRKGDAGHAG